MLDLLIIENPKLKRGKKKILELSQPAIVC